MEQNKESNIGKNWFDRNYKLMMIIPIILIILSLVYLFMFYQKNNDFIFKDVSLSGGTTITITQTANLDIDSLENSIKSKYADANFRKLTNFRTGEIVAFSIESSASSDVLKADIESFLGYTLTDKNSSIEFTGSSLSSNFYKQLLTALLIAFILMSIVIFALFRTFIPSLAVIFAVVGDIVMPLALINFLGIKLSAAGIAAFLMLIGYSVDTDILLTTRAIRTKEGTLNFRLFRAFKTGILMTITALCAVIPVFFFMTGLPESFRQIFLILGLGLFADILNTWLTNMGIIKWYCVKKNIN